MKDMDEKYELLEHVYKDASMASYSTQKLIDKLKDRDNKIKSYLEEILEKYQEFEEKAKDLLKDNDVAAVDESIFKKMMSAMGISKEVKEDNSDAAIADMMIQGISMGSIEMEKKVKAYKDKVSKEYLKLAKEFLKFQEKTVDQLKKYL